jgi:hypothetical protein
MNSQGPMNRMCDHHDEDDGEPPASLPAAAIGSG